MHGDTTSLQIVSRLFILKANLTETSLSVDIFNFTALIVLKYTGHLVPRLYMYSGY